ncbi:MAG: transketolase [Ignavibacteriae bacterium]|nr:transketolase [Ignavibacteriota bacterium]
MNYEEKLIELAHKNENILILTAENRASIRNLPKVISNKFIDTGICEQTLVGISAGLALRGKVPIVHAIAAFLTMRAFEFIRTDIGYPNLNVKLVGNFAGFLSEGNGPTHQAIEDISLMRTIPNINIFCPADIDDLIKGLSTVINYNRPFYIRYNDLQPIVEHEEFALGKAEVFGDGNEIGIFVYGTLFNEAYNAKEILESEGYSVRLINLRTLKPIDEYEIINTINSCKTIVSIEDHYRIGGLYSIITEIIVKEKLIADFLPINLQNKFFKPTKFKNILTHEGFAANNLVNKIKEYLYKKEKKIDVEWSNVK